MAAVGWQLAGPPHVRPEGPPEFSGWLTAHCLGLELDAAAYLDYEGFGIAVQRSVTAVAVDLLCLSRLLIEMAVRRHTARALDLTSLRVSM